MTTTLCARRALPILTILVLAATALAQDRAASDRAAEGDNLAAVVGSEVLVRSGGGDPYYPFGKLQRGDVVKVVGEKYGWTRVHTTGPAFRSFYGYVALARTETAKVRLEGDRARIRALDRLEVLAPNHNTSGNPADSWKSICTIGAGAELAILETIENEKQVIFKVRLPATAEGWVSSASLEPASAAQIEQWRRTARPAAEMSAAAKTSRDVPGGAPPGTAAVATSASPGAPAALEASAPALPPAARDTTALPDGPPPPARAARAALQQRFDDLEAAYGRLREEPIDSAEVAPLRELYLNLSADASSHPTVARCADARAEQLALWGDLQKQRERVESLRGRLATSTVEAQAASALINAAGAYAAVGKLAASVIYDGAKMPRLYRVQDTSTGRTLAYVRPDADDTLGLAALVGTVVGVVGDPQRDAKLGVTFLTPRRIDPQE
jgi:uncharacterized protein YgiM (DUF1202 family)